MQYGIKFRPNKPGSPHLNGKVALTKDWWIWVLRYCRYRFRGNSEQTGRMAALL